MLFKVTVGIRCISTAGGMTINDWQNHYTFHGKKLSGIGHRSHSVSLSKVSNS